MQSQNPSENPSPPQEKPTNSAQPAEPVFDLLLPLQGDAVSTSVKCGKCDAITEALKWNLTPSGIESELEPLKALEMTKRLIFCTHCGNMRLID